MAEPRDKDDRNGLSAFLIKCDFETFRQSELGSITGAIHIDVAGFLFPDPGWSDFVVVILVWWLRALDTLGRGSRVAELRFMDGPFAINVTASDKGVCSIEFLRKSVATSVLGTAKVETLQLIDETQRVAAAALQACTRHELRSRDVDELSLMIAKRRH